MWIIVTAVLLKSQYQEVIRILGKKDKETDTIDVRVEKYFAKYQAVAEKYTNKRLKN